MATITNIKEVEINGIVYIPKIELERLKLNNDNYCIVRTYSAGVFAGNVIKRDGKEIEIANARWIWYWDGASSLSQLAMHGTSKPENCKFPCEVEKIIVTEAIEIIPCTDKAIKSIKEVPIWKK